MKLLISTIVSAVILLLLAGLTYWGFFSTGHLGSYLHIMRGPGSGTMWANVLGSLFQGLFLSLIYQYFYKGEAPLKEGFFYGLLMGLLMSIPVTLFMWANYTIRYTAAIADGMGMGFRILVACIVIGFIFGKKQQQ